MENLTTRQKEVLNLLYGFIDEKGYQPSIREIANELNVKSTNSIWKILLALEKKGYIEKIDKKNRSIKLLVKKKEKGIPIIGKVAAGSPILSDENIIGYLNPAAEYKEKDIFALQVQGDSMVEAGILDDDYVIVKKTNKISNKEIGVFYYFGEFTVKKFKKDKNKIILLPENHKYQPIEIENLENFYVVGRVIGIYRKIQEISE